MEDNSKNIKKICLVSEFPPPAGGIAQQAIILYDNLVQEKNLQIVKVGENDYKGSVFAFFEHVRIVRTIVALIYFYSKLIVKIPRADLIHVFASSYLNFFIFSSPAILFSKIMNKKVVLHYHGGAADEFFSRWWNLVRIPLNYADEIVVPSGFLLAVFQKFGLNPIIIPNILNLDVFKYRKRMCLEPKFISTRHLRKEYNIQCLIKAFSIVNKEYNDAEFLIVGDGPQKNELKVLAEELGCGQSVKFLGRVPNEKIAELYNVSDFALNASDIDNLPVSILEAFASGCIVVSTKAGGIPFIVKHRKSGFLVELGDYVNIAREVKWALEHQEETIRIVQNANNDIKQYSWDSVKPLILGLYAGQLNDKSILKIQKVNQ